MATIKKYEELEVWQLARKLNKEIYFEILRKLKYEDASLRNQMDRSAGSIMDNIAEGFDRSGTKEFIQYLAIAKASAAELSYQLIRLYDREKISDELFQKLNLDLQTILNKIGSFMNYLKKVEHKGAKFLREPEVMYGTK